MVQKKRKFQAEPEVSACQGTLKRIKPVFLLKCSRVMQHMLEASLRAWSPLLIVLQNRGPQTGPWIGSEYCSFNLMLIRLYISCQKC